MNRKKFITASLTAISASVIVSPFSVAEQKLGYNENDVEPFSKLIYANPFSGEDDLTGFVLEGEAKISFPGGKLRLQNSHDASLGQESNFVLWCPETFPADISIRWNFKPIREPGLAMLFFAASGKNGLELFDKSLERRSGIYRQYHSGDINAYHVSYFRRKNSDERRFHTCNLRKSNGFHLVAQGADPIPDADEITDPYLMRLDKLKNEISFYINDLLIFSWKDNGEQFGPVLKSGKIGFRQMAPLAAEYSNLEVYSI